MLEDTVDHSFFIERSAGHTRLCAINILLAILSLTGFALIYTDNLYNSRVEITRIPESCASQETCIFPIALANPGALNYVYLRFGNIQQNFKQYTNSFSPKVFRDEMSAEPNTVKSCRPLLTNEQMGKKFSHAGEELNPADVAIPCGAIALTYPDCTDALIQSMSPSPQIRTVSST